MQTDVSGNVAGEKLHWPTEGAFGECGLDRTEQVDSFLYDELDLERLRRKKLVKDEEYCAECGSAAIARTSYISHSLSVDEVGAPPVTVPLHSWSTCS